MNVSSRVQLATLAAVVLTPMAALAQSNLTTVCMVSELISKFTRVFAFIVFVLAIAAILYSGFLFLTAGGNEAKVESARSALIWGLIGIAVALFANYAIELMKNVVGGQDFADCQFTNIR